MQYGSQKNRSPIKGSGHRKTEGRIVKLAAKSFFFHFIQSRVAYMIHF